MRVIRWRHDGDAAAILVFVVAALVLRAVQFGNPVIQVDEQYYLLAGDRLWHGALPYTDIWDRKPVGLFLIYAAIRVLGGDGIWQYQLVATGCAAATAFLIRRIALRIAPPVGAWAAGLLYLLFLMGNGGDGGQAPVFYNLLTAGAALLAVRAIERPAFDRAAVGEACLAMVLVGAALQVKYTVVFEGAYFGAALLVAAWRRGARVAALLPIGAIWAALALLPTAGAIAAYALLGHLDDFLFANFQSVFLRPASVDGDALPRLGMIAVRTAPLILAAVAGSMVGRKSGAADTRRFLMGWWIAAIAGVVAFGTYHAHYALPLLAPLAVGGAPLFGRWRWATIAVAVAGAGLAVATLHHNRAERGTGAEVRALASYIRARPPASLFVFNGDPVLYHLTGAALPTRWSFPTFLSERRETGSMGTDEGAELRRVMRGRPRFVVTRDPAAAQATPELWRYMAAVLRRDYALALALPVSGHRLLLYERRSTPALRSPGGYGPSHKRTDVPVTASGR